MLFGDTTPVLGRHARSALLSILAWIALPAIGLAQGSGGPLWVPLDTQPAGTPARVVLNTELSNAGQTYFDLFISGFYVSTHVGDDGRTYQEIRVPGLPNLSETGEPSLPVVRAELGIVTSATGASLLDATTYDLRSLPGYLIWPSPIPAQVHDGAPWQFMRDSTTYASPLDYPVGNGAGGTTRSALGGIPASLCSAFPVHWNPSTGTLSVAAHARFGFGHAGGLGTPMKLTSEHAGAAGATLLNWGVVSSDYTIDPFHYDGDYLIVCPSAWTATPELKTFIQVKKTEGFKVALIGAPLNGESCWQLQQSIQAWYAGTPPGDDHYALLAGPLSATPYCVDVNGQLSDKLLSSVDGDAEPEIYLGRLLVANQAELQAQLTKILDYETGPQVNNDGTVLLVAHAEQDQYFDFPSYQDSVRNAAYAQVTPTFVTVYGNNQALGNADVANAVNAGVGVVAYIGHGGTSEWQHWTSAAASFTQSDALALSNGARTPVVWSIACDTGDLSVPQNLASGFMKNTNGGGVSFYGAVKETFGYSTVTMEDTLFQSVYGRGVTRQGLAIDLAEHAAIAADPQWGFDAVYKYLLYGDPAMSIKRHNAGGIWAPIDFLVPIDVIGPCPGVDCCPSCPAPTIDIQTRSAPGAPIPGVKVGIWKPTLAGTDEVFDNRYSGPDGWVHIPAPGLTPGTLYAGYDDGDGRAGFDSIEVVASSVTGASSPGARPLRLTARPTVSSGATRLSFGRSLDAPAALVIFDIGGRVVRTLRAGAGTGYVDWDGRDGGGRIVGAGVYLARLVAGGGAVTTRMVVVR
jgi:hypothetical protein